MRYFSSISAVIFMCMTFGVSVANATTYYISSSTGNDSNNGLTAATAWQSMGKVNSVTFATADRVYLRAGDTFTAGGAGSYNLDWNGTSATHAVIGAYHTDTNGNAVIGLGSAARPKIVSSHVFVVLDATHTSNTSIYIPALNVTGDYVEVRDLETDNWGYGLKVQGDSNVLLDNIKTSGTYTCGIDVDGVNTITISNSEVYRDNLGYGIYNDRANHWCSAIAASYTDGMTVTGNYIHEGWGEGVNTFRASTNTDIEHNLIFSQQALGVYADWAQNVKIHGNLILGTSNSAYWRNHNFVGAGVGIANEPGEISDNTKSAKNISIYDNLVAGTVRGIDVQRSTGSPAVQTVTVYNNTLVDNLSQIASAGCNTSCIAENNVFLTLSTGSADIPAGGGSGFTFHNNYWSQGNPGTGIGDPTSDVYSGLIINKMSGWQSIANASSLPTAQSFAPISGSSTFQQGTLLLPAPYNVDYNGAAHRNPMDLGGIAGTGSSVVIPAAAFSCTPLSGTAPLAITCTDSSTNGPTAWSWTLGDGGTSTAQNPTHTYAAAGTYSVALTATNSAGSNTTTKSGYLTVNPASGSGNVTPNPAGRGTTISVSDTFAAAVTDSNAEVIFWINDSANNLLGRCGVYGTGITAGQPKTVTCTFAIPASAVTGNYHVSGTVFQSPTDNTVIQTLTTFATFTIN